MKEFQRKCSSYKFNLMKNFNGKLARHVYIFYEPDPDMLTTNPCQKDGFVK